MLDWFQVCGGIGATVCVYEGYLACVVGVMHYVLRCFYSFDGIALPAYIGMLYLSFFSAHNEKGTNITYQYRLVRPSIKVVKTV